MTIPPFWESGELKVDLMVTPITLRPHDRDENCESMGCFKASFCRTILWRRFGLWAGLWFYHGPEEKGAGQ